MIIMEIKKNLLYKRSCFINDSIKIMIPTVGEVIDDEENYFSIISILTAMPIDMMVQLDDIGIDFTSITDYDLFLLMFQGLKNRDTRLIFGDLDLNKFKHAINEQNGNMVLYDKENQITIDRAIYEKISETLRIINHLEKNRHKPANPEAKEFMLKRARNKMRRKNNHIKGSIIEPLIISMVNTEQYKYNFESTRELSIYQFNESVRQVIRKVDYNNLMYGVYTGNVNSKEISQDKLNWLSQ